MKSHLGCCCVLKGHHNFPRHCPPASRGCAELSSAVPKGENTGMGRGAGWEGELPLEREQQRECWGTGCSSPAPHQPSLGSDSDRRRRSHRRALGCSWHNARPSSAADWGGCPSWCGGESRRGIKWGCLRTGKEKGV